MIILAGILNILIPLVLLVQVVVALLLILVVLMQRPKQEGLGAAFGAGMTDQMFGAQTTNVLQKATVWFGIIFFACTLILTILYNKKNTANAIATAPAIEEVITEGEVVATDAEASSDISLAEQLNQVEEAVESATLETSEKETLEVASEKATEVKEVIEATVAEAPEKVESIIEEVKEEIHTIEQKPKAIE